MNVFKNLSNENFTRFKVKAKKQLGNKYSQLGFSDEFTDAPTTLPNFYFEQLSPIQTGRDMNGTKINVVLDTIQITVSSNVSKKEAKDLIDVAVDILLSMRYEMVMMPTPKQYQNLHQYVIRARRYIGAGDVL